MMIRTALVLAAGKNTRFDTGIPKSLHQVGETTLLERHLRQFHRIGIHQVAVVTGFRDQMIADHVNKLRETLEHPVTLIHNPEFDKANGLSIRVARSWIESISASHFVCTMSDHLFADSFYDIALDKFSAPLPNSNILHLLVDKPGDHNTYIDLHDVTRVAVRVNDSGELDIVRVSKLMEPYHYFDTGFFILHHDVFDHLDLCASQHKNSISELVNHLADLNESAAIDVSGVYWNDVDTPDDFRMVQRQLDFL